MVYFIASAIFIFAMIAYVMIKAPRARDLPHDYASDDPYLIASARTVLTAQPDPLSGIEQEPMGV